MEESYNRRSIDKKNSDSISLKESTKQLLRLVENLQIEVYPSNSSKNKNCKALFMHHEDSDDDDDDENDRCTIYDRLTGKCQCLNRTTYNDLMMHFNESNSKHKITTMGNIVKNMKTVKKILYLGANYTKNALAFLNEGFTTSLGKQKTKIADACAFADIFNIFEDYSFVRHCLSWTHNCYNDQDFVLQALAANFIHELSLVDKGKYYMTLNSRLFDEINKTIRKKALKLDIGTLELLKRTLNALLIPVGFDTARVVQMMESSNYKHGMARRVIQRLKFNVQNMTQTEILSHLEILRNISLSDYNKKELEEEMHSILELFRQLLHRDVSGINILITIILDNILPQKEPNETTKETKLTKCQDSQADMEKPIKLNEIEFTKIPNAIASFKTHSSRDSRKAAIIVPIETDVRHR